jgi:hypothetical protein
LPKTQTNKRAILTDNNLKVLGVDNIYAIGDCSTIQQNKMLVHLDNLFKEYDKNNDNKLDINEFNNLIKDSIKKYPQLETFIQKTNGKFHK